MKVETKEIHNEVQDGFPECSYIHNGGFVGSFLHVVMQSDSTNQIELNFGGLETKMSQIKSPVFFPKSQVMQPAM
ncbi:hypothetical protein DD594_26625, partial [Enterobacter cloacae complex sp. 4DZ1-17B1]|uniref:hypothetical protein n=1 Tax=Enterobacter cloacae complex sp. 4DZ1-17B1 TaxID=2511991 RepID=UPI001025F8B1